MVRTGTLVIRAEVLGSGLLYRGINAPVKGIVGFVCRKRIVFGKRIGKHLNVFIIPRKTGLDGRFHLSPVGEIVLFSVYLSILGRGIGINGVAHVIGLIPVDLTVGGKDVIRSRLVAAHAVAEQLEELRRFVGEGIGRPRAVVQQHVRGSLDLLQIVVIQQAAQIFDKVIKIGVVGAAVFHVVALGRIIAREQVFQDRRVLGRDIAHGAFEGVRLRDHSLDALGVRGLVVVAVTGIGNQLRRIRRGVYKPRDVILIAHNGERVVRGVGKRFVRFKHRFADIFLAERQIAGRHGRVNGAVVMIHLVDLNRAVVVQAGVVYHAAVVVPSLKLRLERIGANVIEIRLDLNKLGFGICHRCGGRRGGHGGVDVISADLAAVVGFTFLRFGVDGDGIRLYDLVFRGGKIVDAFKIRKDRGGLFPRCGDRDRLRRKVRLEIRARAVPDGGGRILTVDTGGIQHRVQEILLIRVENNVVISRQRRGDLGDQLAVVFSFPELGVAPGNGQQRAQRGHDIICVAVGRTVRDGDRAARGRDGGPVFGAHIAAVKGSRKSIRQVLPRRLLGCGGEGFRRKAGQSHGNAARGHQHRQEYAKNFRGKLSLCSHK